MIRLYCNEGFRVGARLEIASDEIRYFRSVHRGKGEICLFNQQGQLAYGRIEKNEFVIESLKVNVTPIWRATCAVALPENNLIPVIIRSLSELGFQSLRFFEAERSQSFKKRLNLERWQKIALEACRQSCRPRPLEIETGAWTDKKFLKSFDARFFFDEAPVSLSASVLLSASGARGASDALAAPAESVLAVIGCEGGWTEAERDMARQHKFDFLHFKTPILRVETAVSAAGFYSLNSVFNIAMGWREG